MCYDYIYRIRYDSFGRTKVLISWNPVRLEFVQFFACVFHCSFFPGFEMTRRKKSIKLYAKVEFSSSVPGLLFNIVQRFDDGWLDRVMMTYWTMCYMVQCLYFKGISVWQYSYSKLLLKSGIDLRKQRKVMWRRCICSQVSIRVSQYTCKRKRSRRSSYNITKCVHNKVYSDYKYVLTFGWLISFILSCEFCADV